MNPNFKHSNSDRNSIISFPTQIARTQGRSNGDRAIINLEVSATIVAKLRHRFIELAYVMSDELSGALETIEANPHSSLLKIHHIAHSLAGNAETFGFPVIGRAAFTLSDMILVGKTHGNDNIDRDMIDLGYRLLDMLRQIPEAVTH